jgi:hypothetical protein
MSFRLGLTTLIAALALSGTAWACAAEKAASASDQPVVAATQQPAATPATGTTTTPKTTEVKTGG